MGTGIDESIKLACLIARNNDWLATDPSGVIIVIFRNLAFMRQINPIAFKNILHFERKQIFIGEDIASTAKHSRFCTVFNGISKQIVEIARFIDHCGHDFSSWDCPLRAILNHFYFYRLVLWPALFYKDYRSIKNAGSAIYNSSRSAMPPQPTARRRCSLIWLSTPSTSGVR